MSAITRISAETDCPKHSAVKGFACWDIYTSGGKILSAVCNKRARKAGFVGHISDTAMRKVTKK